MFSTISSCNSIINNKQILNGNLFYNDGSSLTGWTNFSTNTVVISATEGMPVSSFKLTGSNYNGNNACCAYINLPFSLLNKTIFFNAKTISGICNLFFMCNSTGAGQMLRLHTQSTSGFAITSSWSNWSSPTIGSSVASSTWLSIKIYINLTGKAEWYLNGVLQNGIIQVSNNNNNYIGIHGDALGSTVSYFDNINVIRCNV
jgi:hypothetical protein